MPRRARPPAVKRHRTAAVGPRPDANRIALRPLSYQDAARGLFSVKPKGDEADLEKDEEVESDG